MMALYPWLETTQTNWSNAIERKVIPAATMVVSSPGMGADQLLQKMAASVLCATGSTPCGLCHACNLLAADSHPDFHQVVPEKGAKSINVEQIRAVNRLAYESSQLGGFRVITITPADVMNESAANALLKTLEEPPSDCCFILNVHQVSQLLPTIVSRCHQIHLPQLDQGSVAVWASSQLGEKVDPYVVKLNGFSPLRVTEFIEAKQHVEFDKLAEGFISFLHSPVEQLIEFSGVVNRQPDVNLNWLWYLLADAQKCHFSIEQIDTIPHSLTVSQLCAYPSLHQQTQDLCHLIQQLKQFSGLNSELLITNWLLNFKG